MKFRRKYPNMYAYIKVEILPGSDNDEAIKIFTFISKLLSFLPRKPKIGFMWDFNGKVMFVSSAGFFTEKK